MNPSFLVAFFFSLFRNYYSVVVFVYIRLFVIKKFCINNIHIYIYSIIHTMILYLPS